MVSLRPPRCLQKRSRLTTEVEVFGIQTRCIVDLLASGLQGTGTHAEMALDERTKLATEGLVVAAVDVERRAPERASTSAPDSNEDLDASVTQVRLRGRIRITTRAMWVDQGRLLEQLHKVREFSPPVLGKALLEQSWFIRPLRLKNKLALAYQPACNAME